ncbi:SDR family NAD(P)-dependent oxidoreductase [Halocatena marina]|uniref:SDR family NAD(P)-dependent oxidoreductase n=1 Tax=Halocatena marina TaxID=2934937 RepID=A0ABD5YZ29_9EURY|nr:SDR family oxidoreductase [Halocatena marina]
MSDTRLVGAHIVVTGGASGIGQGVARRIATAGGNVSVFDLDEEGAAETVERVEDAGSEAIAVKVNIANKTDLENGVEQAIDALGPIDGLVNAGGVQVMKPFLKLTEDDIDHHLSVNIRGTFLASQVVGSHMVEEERDGAIVNIGSTAGAGSPNYGQSAYAASKGAIDSLTTAIAIDLAEYNIRCNVVHPGATKTPMLDRLADCEIGEQSRKGKSLAERHLVGRIGEPADIAHLCVLLLSGEGEWITAQGFVVDGGVVHGK